MSKLSFTWRYLVFQKMEVKIVVIVVILDSEFAILTWRYLVFQTMEVTPGFQGVAIVGFPSLLTLHCFLKQNVTFLHEGLNRLIADIENRSSSLKRLFFPTLGMFYSCCHSCLVACWIIALRIDHCYPRSLCEISELSHTYCTVSDLLLLRPSSTFQPLRNIVDFLSSPVQKLPCHLVEAFFYLCNISSFRELSNE